MTQRILGPTGSPTRRRRLGLLPLGAVMALVALALLAIGGPGAARIQTAAAASGIDPSFVSFTLEGCRNNGGITLPNGSGDFVCPDAAYTTGNLGKNWSELDLVPFRTTTQLGTQAGATTTYDIRFALDSVSGAAVGYDVISQPVVNTSLSDDSCAIVSSGQQGTGSGTIYRLVTVTQDPGTTCVFDWYGRLALGAHLYSGASLHANLFNKDGASSGVGQKEVSILVNEVAPQELRKDMSATRNADHAWNLTKGATPAEVSFGNVCDPNYDNTLPVSITITWTRLAASPSGDATIVTNIYAKNPASRAITVTVNDKIYEGADQTNLLDEVTGAPVSIPANTELLVLTHSTTESTTATTFNDVATGTYMDPVTNVPIPQTTTATASATVQTGTTTNTSASITDDESITGSGLTFSADSASLGSFTGGYVPGTFTTGPVGWASGTQSGSDSATLGKTVKLDPAAAVTGTLSDTANLVGSDGFTKQASASVNISSSVTGSLTINKTIPNVLSGSETASFSFLVTGPGGYSQTVNFSFAAGETSKSETLTGLGAGSYNVHENPATGWGPQTDQPATISASSCSPSTRFNNGFAPASARAAKDTDPDGSEAGWELILTGPGAPAGGEKITTTGAGFVNFTTTLQEGAYTITETGKTGWTQTGTSGSCSFTVDYPADAGRTFSCTISNRSRGSAGVVKTVSGGVPTGAQSFLFTLRQGATPIIGNPGTILESKVANAANGGVFSFSTSLIPGQTYQVCEEVLAGWSSTIGPNPFVPEQYLADGVTLNPNVDNSPVCTSFVAGFGTTTTIRVDNTPPPGGRALTIGYWKTHGSCSTSSGKNTRGQLDIALGSGIYIGSYNVTTCARAVALLNKSDLQGKKQSSDPLYNLAAQLMAYKLNIRAGAGTCGAAVSAASSADTLLAKYGFNGTGSYTKLLSAADATLANQLANTLDRYNNDLLC